MSSPLALRVRALDDVPAPMRGFYRPDTAGDGFVLAVTPGPIAPRDPALDALIGGDAPAPTPAPAATPGAAPAAPRPLGDLSRDELIDALDRVAPRAPEPEVPADVVDDWGQRAPIPTVIRVPHNCSQQMFEQAVAEAERTGARLEFGEAPKPAAYRPTSADVTIPAGASQAEFERAVERAHLQGGHLLFGPAEEPKPEDAARDDARRHGQADFERAYRAARAAGRDPTPAELGIGEVR